MEFDVAQKAVQEKGIGFDAPPPFYRIWSFRDEIDLKKTGVRLKELCMQKQVTVQDIQKKLFIGSFQSVYAWFSGKCLPSLDNMYRLSRVLGVSMDEMIVGVDALENSAGELWGNDPAEQGGCKMICQGITAVMRPECPEKIRQERAQKYCGIFNLMTSSFLLRGSVV